MIFNEYAEQRKLKLLREDILFIKNIVMDMSRERRRKVLVEYADIWCEVRDKEPHPARKQNRGRYAANTWLRTRNLKPKRKK